MARKKMPASDKNAETVSARITTLELQALTEIAEADDRTVSYVVARAIREYLDRVSRRPSRPK